MFLQKLVEYANERMDLPPTLYEYAPVRYIIDLDADGNPSLIDTVDPGSRATRRGVRRLAPNIKRSVAVRPLLMADNAEYTLGLAREGANTARVAQCHQAYQEILERCAAETREPSVRAIYEFVSDKPLSKLTLSQDYDAGARVTFRVNGDYPIDLPSVREFWAGEHDPSGDRNAAVMDCLICGESRPALERLQAKVKGIPGGQTSGTDIISANSEAFESYGLSASHVGATCAECGRRFTHAINHLLGGEYSCVRFSNLAFIFWTRTEVETSFFEIIGKPSPEQARRLIESVHSGTGAMNVDDTAFYGAVLSGSGGRAVVRDWIDTTVGEVKARLASWFQLQRVVGQAGEEPLPMGLYALSYATVREPRDLPRTVPRALLRSALTGTPLQWDLLYQAVRRNRAEQGVTRTRAALIKLVMLSQTPNDEEDYMVKLDPNHPSPGYQCGRLLAVLEQTQRQALGRINATIVDRFFGTASSAPRSVFSRLVRGAQPHLATLRRDNRGAHFALQQRIEDILSQIDDFPNTLNLKEQGLFALGYYHQRANDRSQARERSQSRDAENTDDDNTTGQEE